MEASGKSYNLFTEIRLPELNRPYRYRIRTVSKPDIHVKSTQDREWLLHIVVIFTGMEGDHYRYQILCLKAEDLSANRATYSVEASKFYVLDDVRVLVNFDGEIVKVRNLASIRKYWKKERKRWETFVTGDSATVFFNYLEQILYDEPSLIRYLSDYMMYGLFFNGTVFGSLSPGGGRKITKVPSFLFSPIEETWKYQKTENISQEETFFSVSGSTGDPQQELNLKKYEGIFRYKNNRIADAYLEIVYNKYYSKHSILWIG